MDTKETKQVIADMLSDKSEGDLGESLDVGGAPAEELEVTLVEPVSAPDLAKVQPEEPKPPAPAPASAATPTEWGVFTSEPQVLPTPMSAEDQIKQLGEQNSALLRQIAALASGVPRAEPVVESAVAQTVPVAAPAETASPFASPAQFVSEEDFMGVFQDHAALNRTLNAVRERIRADVMQVIPMLISNTARVEMQRQGLVNEFYTKNPDLRPLAPFVAHVVREIESSHPDWDAPKVLDMAEKATRERLMLASRSTEPRPAAKPAPKPASRSFAPAPGARPAVPFGTKPDRKRELMSSLLED